MLSGKRSEQKSSFRISPEDTPPQALLQTYSEFKKWLNDRQRHFDEVSASPSDIADLALKVGFPEQIVRQWEQHKKWEIIEHIL